LTPPPVGLNVTHESIGEHTKERRVAKEKFELVFLGGGAMLNALSNRLRRAPATPRESIGAAMYELEQSLLRHPLPEQGADAVAARLRVVREELCTEAPRLSVMTAQLDGLARTVEPVRELAGAVGHLRGRVEAWLD
jgi:hypothetical protein